MFPIWEDAGQLLTFAIKNNLTKFHICSTSNVKTALGINQWNLVSSNSQPNEVFYAKTRGKNPIILDRKDWGSKIIINKILKTITHEVFHPLLISFRRKLYHFFVYKSKYLEK